MKNNAINSSTKDYSPTIDKVISINLAGEFETNNQDLSNIAGRLYDLCGRILGNNPPSDKVGMEIQTPCGLVPNLQQKVTRYSELNIMLRETLERLETFA